jgi:hypothetical protein
MGAGVLSGPLLEVVAIFRGKGQTVDNLELFDFFQGIPSKGGFTFKSVKHDSFEEISDGHIFQLGDGLEDFEQPFFEADAGLNPFDFDVGHWYICTYVCIGTQFVLCSASRICPGREFVPKGQQD